MFEDIRCKFYILDLPLLFQKYKSTRYSEQGVAIFFTATWKTVKGEIEVDDRAT